MKLLIGTSNKGKITEVRSALKSARLEIVTPDDLGIVGSPPEDFPTLEENARSKALFYFERSNRLPTIAEDTGLYVDALSDELGVKTRRWGAGATATDDEWLAFFLDRMKTETDRTAKFVCALCYVDASGAERVFHSESRGTIVHEPRAAYLPGLPVSSVFLPEGYDRVFSALTHDEKNALSHRGKAVAQFLAFVEHGNSAA
jgi:XTP/dITP diphosphohydrolase